VSWWLLFASVLPKNLRIFDQFRLKIIDVKFVSVCLDMEKRILIFSKRAGFYLREFAYVDKKD